VPQSRLRHLRPIAVLLSSNALAAATIAGGTVVVSRIVSPSAFGEYSYAAQFALALYPALTLRFEQALPLIGTKRIFARYMLLGILALTVLSTTLLGLLGEIALSILVKKIDVGVGKRDVFALIMLMAFSLSLAGIYQSATLALGNLSRMAVARILRAVAMVAMQVLLVLAIGGGAFWLLVADIGASLMQALLLAGGVGMAGVWGLLRRPVRQTARRLSVLAKRYKTFPLITLPHLLVHSALGLLLTTTLGAAYGASALGQYFLMRKLIYGVLALFSTAIYQHAIAESAQVPRTGVYSVAKRAFLLVATVGAVSAVTILVGGPQLFEIAAGEEWSMAGRMAIATVPLILMEPITSSLAFVPVFLGLQRVAFGVAVLQGIVGLAAITVASMIGLNVMSALTISSCSMSIVMIGYVFWLLQRAKQVAEGGIA
jgi:O-antigen/teichoic acid export membrane protein